MQPTPQSVIEHTKRTNCTGMWAIPAWLQIWAQDTQVVEFLAKLEVVVRRVLLETFSTADPPFSSFMVAGLYHPRLEIL